MSLGARLKELRVRKGESLQQVANAVGASKAHIWELEKGTSKNPTIEMLTNIAVHFDTSLAVLVGEDPNAPGEDTELVAMFRDFKGLDDRDRAWIRTLMKQVKSDRKARDGED